MNMKKNRIFIILPVICCTLSGCSGKTDIKFSKSVPEETKSIEENSENEESVQALSNEEKEDSVSSYTWYKEPSVMADNIIVADIEFSADKSFSNYYASYESAIVELNGKYGIISYDGTYIAEPEYTRYSPLNAMMACSLLEVSDENLGSVEVFNGEYDIEVKHNEPYGFGYMAYSYYATEGTDVVSLWGDVPFIDGVAQGTFLKDNNEDYRQFAVVQKADGYIDDKGIPWIKENSTENIFGIGNTDSIKVSCEYTGGISPYSTSLTVGALEKNGKWGYFNSDGEQIIDFICEPTVFPVTKNVNGYDVTELNSTVYQTFYSGEGVPYNMTENIIAVRTSDGYGYFDIEGNEIIPAGTFEEARPFHNGMAWVKDSATGLWGIIKLTDSEPEEEVTDIHYIGADFNNLQSGGLVAENDDIVVYLTYKDTSVFNSDSYNNYDSVYTGSIWKYEKNNGTFSLLVGGEGMDSIWSATNYDYPAENINVSEDNIVYFSQYNKESSSTLIFRLDSATGGGEEITRISGRINTMVLIDDSLYITAEAGLIRYDLKQNKPEIIFKTSDSDWNLNLLSFYENCLYYSFGSADHVVKLGSYNLNTKESELISLSDLSNQLPDIITWYNAYASETSLISIEYNCIAEYSFIDGTLKTYLNPYKNLPKDIPRTPVALVCLDGDYYSYTGNVNMNYSNSYRIIKLKKDFSSAEDYAGLFSIFQATDGSTFIERHFIFGLAYNGLWTASDSIVRKYSSDGSSETLYKK